MKKLFLIFTGCLCCLFASAQYNYYKLSIGAGPAAAMAFGDLKKNFIRPAGVVSFDFNITPFACVGLELQKGFLSGGDSVDVNIDVHHRFFKNSYISVLLNGKVQLAQFVDFESSNLLYALRGFYIGTGVGLMSNKMTEIKRTKSNGITPYTFPGEDKGSEIMVPIKTGIAFNFEDRWRYTKVVLQFDYTLNMVFGETMDGYNDPPQKFKNMHGDFYGITSVTLKYCFGPEGLF